MRPRSPLVRPETPGCSARRHPNRATARGAGLVAGVLLVAAAGGASAGGGWGPYRVGAGDSLWALAARHGTTVDRIRAMNGLTDDGLSIGDLLYLPGSGPPAAGPPAAGDATTPAAPAQPPGGHVVQSGESLSLLAARSRQSVADLAAQNGLQPDDGLRIGQILLLSPGSPAPDPAATTGTAPAETAPAATSAGGASVVSTGTTSGVSARVAAIQALIRAEAARQGLDPALALAVASVESSFNSGAVSRTGAVGVMQLMPRTARWLAAQLGQPIDRTDPAQNITGGVAFLRYLLAATSSNLPIAIAAYYQGLDSVRRSGFFPDTAVYVAKVTARQAKFA